MPKAVDNILRFKSVVESLEDGVFLFDGTRIEFANTALVSMTGYSCTELTGMALLSMFSTEEQEKLESCLVELSRDSLVGKKVSSFEFSCCHQKKQAQFPAKLILRKITSNDGVLYIGTLKNQSVLVGMQNKLDKLQGEFNQTLNNIPDVFYRTDANGVFTMLSPAAKKLIGYEVEELLGTKITDLYASEKGREQLIASLKKADGKPVNIEATMIKKDGTAIWVSTNAYMRFDSNHKFIGVEGVARDSTQRHNAELVLHKSANTDPLTGLANRLCFNVELSRAVVESTNSNIGLAMLYMDLDGFKDVNDTHGHQIGDDLLCLIARRIKTACRKSDLVARLGGDEFVVLLEDGPREKDTELIAKKIIKQISTPFKLDSLQICIGASIGISYFPQYSKDAEHFLRDADDAMYAAKKAGKGQFRSCQDMDKEIK